LLTDIVINASPDAIPYSLLTLKNLWKDRLNIEIQCYTHSTVASLSEEAKNFQNLVQNNQTTKLPKLKVVLIWKTGEYFG
jgi:aminoacyl tRNA synthase complex-interacting multifunctional protein 2